MPQPSQVRSIKRPPPVMADYDAMLDRAVKSLADSSLIARTALYERLRAALVSEIESAGLSEFTDSELEAFDLAVDRLERRTKEPTKAPSELRALDQVVDRREARIREPAEEPAKPPSELPSPTKADRTISDGWLRDLLTRASNDDDDATAVEATSKASAEIGGELPVSGGSARQLNAALQNSFPEPDFLKMLEDVASNELGELQEAPEEMSHAIVPNTSVSAIARGRQTPESAISRELEEAISREVTLQLVLERTSRDFVSDSAAFTGGAKRRRRWLLAGGGVSAALGAALVFVAVTPQSFVKDVVPSFSTEVFSRSFQRGMKDALLVEAPQFQSFPSAADEPLNSEQTRQVLKQLIQWSLKTGSDQPSQEPRSKPPALPD